MNEAGNDEHPAHSLIKRRKRQYPVSASLGQYLHHFGRLSRVPLVYDDLTHFEASVPYENPAGEETLWLTVVYTPEVMAELRPQLAKIYAMLKIGGDLSLVEHLEVERIDFGEFGNSHPFRIRITNVFNGNSDYYYVKRADASRIYGLEFEHILSPNRINYLVNGNTLIEEHIAGVPGMRSVNYVLDITPDFEEVQYRVRPIDFDQQSYEGSLQVYRAHRFPDNKPVDDLVHAHLNNRTILQYRSEERSQMALRARVERPRLTGLFSTMRKDTLAPGEHVETLRRDLSARYHPRFFEACRSMGDLTAAHFHHAMEYPAAER